MIQLLATVCLLVTFPVSVVGYNAYVSQRMARELPLVDRDSETGRSKCVGGIDE